MLNYNIRWRTGSHSCRRFQSDMLDPEARLHIGGTSCIPVVGLVIRLKLTWIWYIYMHAQIFCFMTL